MTMIGSVDELLLSYLFSTMFDSWLAIETPVRLSRLVKRLATSEVGTKIVAGM